MPRTSRVLVLALAALALAGSRPDLAGAATTVRVASGLSRPLYVTAPKGDARLFIVEQRGTVRVLARGQVLAASFLDIDSLVIDTAGSDERGLLGLAFHPAYPGSPYCYVNYVNNANQTVIATFAPGASSLLDARSRAGATSRVSEAEALLEPHLTSKKKLSVSPATMLIIQPAYCSRYRCKSTYCKRYMRNLERSNTACQCKQDGLA